MTHLVLHIGHPKTGTTSLQFALRGNMMLLNKYGIHYPDSGVDHKHASAAPFLLGSENPALRRRMNATGPELVAKSEKVWRRIVRDCKKRHPSAIVLSGEAYWGAPDAGKVSGMRGKLEELCSSAEVVGYLRSPAPLFLSRLNQRTRMTQTLPVVSPHFFRKPISAYMSGGFQRISLQIFDRAEMVNGDVVDDFCAHFLPGLKEPLDREVIARSNDSISAEAMALIQEFEIPSLDASAQRKRQFRNRVVRTVRECDQALAGFTRPRLFPEVADAVVARSLDLTWLRDEHGVVFKDLDYARVGASVDLKLEELTRIPEFCPLDQDRLSELRAQVKERVGSP